MDNLKNKNIVVGVCGGIAAYKSCELVRSLIKKGAVVQVVMTKNAAEFITPLTLQTLSNRKVATDQFDLDREDSIGHIEIADNADAIVICPATASFIGKVSSGIADSLLSTIILATSAPVIFCPSMNVNMFNNPAVTDNIARLEKYGYRVMDPSEGELACGWEGKGRLPEITDIVSEIERTVSKKDLAQKKILITTGPTREFIDPVRFISNPSTGKTGYALARAAWMRGASVTTISGITTVVPPNGVKNIEVTSAKEMYDEVIKHAENADIIIKTAAVSDYSPENVEKTKIKKDKDSVNVKLKRTRDILFELGKRFPEKVIVGFAAETNDIVRNSLKKIKDKNVDFIIANDVTRVDSGFGTDTNSVSIIDRNGKVTELPLMSKEEVAHKILNEIVKFKKEVKTSS